MSALLLRGCCSGSSGTASPLTAVSLPPGGLDYLVLNHIGVSPFQMWGGDVEHTRWLMQVRIPSRSSHGAQ